MRAEDGARSEPEGRNELVYAGTAFGIGRFRYSPRHPRFGDTGPTRGWLLVFPRTPVIIAHAGQRPVVADATRVMLYNARQEYQRRPLSAEGDHCDWFAFAPSSIAEAVAPFDPAVVQRLETPFSLTDGPVSAGAYWLQREMFARVTSGATVDPLRLEEAAMDLLARVVADVYRARGVTALVALAKEKERRDAELVDAACRLLARRFPERLPLSDLAAALAVSPFHLCRVFRRGTGRTLHGYQEQLRLRAALDRIPGSRDLTTVGLDLGYSSHSHFTSAFRRAFGVTPSAVARSGAPLPRRGRARS